MSTAARESYLVTEVMTTPPQKLQLMLVDAAIRCAERARQKWQAQADGEASEALGKAQQIVGELLSGLNREANPELVGKVASIYLFIFRSLAEANQNRDQQKLDDALRVLRIERATWARVCEKLAATGQRDDLAAGLSLEG